MNTSLSNIPKGRETAMESSYSNVSSPAWFSIHSFGKFQTWKSIHLAGLDSQETINSENLFTLKLGKTINIEDSQVTWKPDKYAL